MDKVWEETFLLHSRTIEFKNLVKETQDFVKLILETFNKPYIAYSGGKDSTVMVHLIHSIIPNVQVIHWDYGKYLMPRNLEAKVLAIAKKIGAEKVRVFSSNRYNSLKRRVKNEWGKIFMGIILPILAKEGFDCSFIGLRAEESIRRKMKTKHPISHDKYIANAFPLHNWSWKDIYAYLILNKVPYLREHYDKYANLLGYDKARFVTFFDPDFKHLGSENIDGILMINFKNIEK